MSSKFNFIYDRKELAKAINFGKYPVLTMEIGHPMKGWEGHHVYEGCKLRIPCAFDHSYFHDCYLSMFGEDQTDMYRDHPHCYTKLHINSKPACLSSSFGIHDLDEMVEYAQTPIVEPGQTVVVVFKDSVRNIRFVRKMKVSDKVSDHTFPVATINTIEEE